MHSQLKDAILEMDPTAADSQVKEMLEFADKDGDGKVSFEEFKKIMLYKPPAEPSGSLPQEKAE